MVIVGTGGEKEMEKKVQCSFPVALYIPASAWSPPKRHDWTEVSTGGVEKGGGCVAAMEDECGHEVQSSGMCLSILSIVQPQTPRGLSSS